MAKSKSKGAKRPPVKGGYIHIEGVTFRGEVSIPDGTYGKVVVKDCTFVKPKAG